MRRTFLFAILIFYFFTTNNSLAQTTANSLLVDGNPPLTRDTVTKSADFFQWAMGGNFTAGEQAEYERHLIRVWREKDEGSIRVIGEIVVMRDKLVGQPPEKLKPLVEQIQSGLLKELRAQPNDGLAQVLLKMYDRTHDSSSQSAGALVGEWEESYSGNSDHSTGAGTTPFRSSDHAKNIVRFYADGSYKSAFINQSRFSDVCKITVSYVGEGIFSLDGNTLRLKERTRRETSRSCWPTDNYDKELQPGNYDYPWQLERDEKGLKLILVVNGKPHVFYKIEGAGVFGDE
jgi:hypothetical protein